MSEMQGRGRVGKVTEASVAEAARRLVEAGQKPTLAAVLGLLGGGSQNLASRLLREWKERQPKIRAAEFQIDPRISELIVEQLSVVSKSAAAEAEARADEAEESLKLCEAEAEDLQGQVESLDAALARLQDQHQQQGGLVQALRGEIADVRTDAEKQVAAAKAEAERQVGEARAELERERAAAMAANQELARATLRLEAMPRLEAEIERLRGALEASESARHQAEKSAAVGAESVERLNTLVIDLKEREHEARQLAQAAQAETEKALRDVNRAEKGEQACQARLETAGRELESAQKAAKAAQEKASKAGEDLAHARGQVEALIAREKQLTRELEQARKTKPGQAKES